MGGRKGASRARALALGASNVQAPSGPAAVVAAGGDVVAATPAPSGIVLDGAQLAAGTVTYEAEDAPDRAEEIAALPTFGQVTKLKPVTQQKVVHISPLRSGKARNAYFNEAATSADVMRAVSLAYGVVSEILGGDSALPFGTVVPAGRAALSACKSSKKYNGIFKLRCTVEHAAAAMAKLSEDFNY